MDENSKVHIDYKAMIEQITDRAIIEFVSIVAPDEETRRVLVGTMNIHRKYGIDAATSMRILMEIAELNKKPEE